MGFLEWMGFGKPRDELLLRMKNPRSALRGWAGKLAKASIGKRVPAFSWGISYIFFICTNAYDNENTFGSAVLHDNLCAALFDLIKNLSGESTVKLCDGDSIGNSAHNRSHNHQLRSAIAL